MLLHVGPGLVILCCGHVLVTSSGVQEGLRSYRIGVDYQL